MFVVVLALICRFHRPGYVRSRDIFVCMHPTAVSCRGPCTYLDYIDVLRVAGCRTSISWLFVGEVYGIDVRYW